MTKERAIELVEELRAYEYRLGKIFEELAYSFPHHIEGRRASAFVEMAQSAVLKARADMFFDNDLGAKLPQASELDKENQS